MSTTVVTKGKCNIDALKRIVSNFLKRDVEISDPLVEPAVPRGGNFVSDAWRVIFFMKDGGKSKYKLIDSKEMN